MLRFADFTLSPDRSEVWCVQERHSDGNVSRAIVAVPLDGSAAENPAAIRELVTGADFFAFPTPSPDGRRLAWICWNHPRMPWDGTELRVAVIEDGLPGHGRLVKGGMQESVVAPLWRDAASLYVVTDWPGWWNVYQVGLLGQPPQALYPAEEEFADPLWQLGARPYAVLADGRLAVLHGGGGMRLGVLDPETGDLADLDPGFPLFVSGLSADGMSVLGVAGGPATPLAVVRVDVATGGTQVLWQESADLPDAAYLPIPRQVRLEGRYGRTVHAFVYPPANPEVTAPQDERPPYVVWVHGGPDGQRAATARHREGLLHQPRHWRRGRELRGLERLRPPLPRAAAPPVGGGGRGGRHRCRARAGRGGRGRRRPGWRSAAARPAAGQRWPRSPPTPRLRRCSAAATSYFGVADLREFATQTHDFESRYLDGLIGPLPGFEAVYAERSPAGHVSRGDLPDPAAAGPGRPGRPARPSPRPSPPSSPPTASRHAYLAFEGESHGFRRSETIITSLEAELSFYAQILGFTPPGIPELKLTRPGQRAPETTDR